MKNVQIPEDLFLNLVCFHLLGMDSLEDSIRQALEKKWNAVIDRHLYSKYKTTPTEEERENARKEYLDRKAVPKDFRWNTPPWEQSQERDTLL